MSSELRRLRRELAARGIQLRSDGQDLQLRAPRGALDDALRARLREHKSALIAALQAEREAPPRAPLGSTQRQLWFGEQLAPGSDAHLLVVEGELRGPLSVERFERALHALMVRHEALRTQIHVSPEGLAEQQVLGPEQLSGAPWRVEPGEPADIDPRRAPLWRVELRPEGPERHRFTLRMHHMIVDGAALELLLDELGRSYVGSAPRALGATPAALARAELERGHGPRFEARLREWSEQLADARPVELPGESEPSPLPDPSCGRVRTTLDARAWAELLACARAHETTPFVLVAAALGLVLRRWVGRERVWIGVPHSNRDTPERERAIASLVETTLLELDGRGDPSCAQLVERTRAAWLRCLDYAELPLDRVIAQLGARGLPDLTLNFIPFARLGLELPGVEVELRGHMPGARFDLTIYAYPPPDPEGELRLELVYRSARFEAARVEALGAQLERALAAFVADGQLRASAISLADEATPLAASDMPAPTFDPLARLSSAPSGAPALRCSLASGAVQELDYGQLRSVIELLAGELRALGATRVAIVARREPALVAAMFGAWAAGACFVILDPAHPRARRLDQAERAQVDAWIELADADSLAPAGRARIVLPAWPERSPPSAPALARPELADETLAWIPFTSGSTGAPVGVLVEHGPLARTFAWYLRELEISPADRFASLAGLSHDPSLRELLLPACAGARVCFPPDEPARMGPELSEWIAREQITILHLSPALARVLARAQLPLPALRYLLFGGAPLRGSDLASWRRLAPNAQLCNGYGATETPQIAALHRCEARDELRARVPIGRGVAGTQLELRTDAGRPAGLGELAQIVVRGPNLARARLEPDARSTRLREGAFFSGDYGRLLPGGAVEFVARRDRQVELRGHRIELAELEAALLRAPGVREAGACVLEAEGRRELLAAVVGPKPEDLPRLRASLAARLPRAWIPARIAALPQLPLNANAKLDARALARVIEAAGERGPSASPRPLRSRLERALAEIWAELLGVAQPGPDDDFFALGGHSLLSVELVARIASELGLHARVTLVFEHPRLGALAAALAELRAPALSPARLPLDAPAPASFAQERLWLLERLEPHAPQLHLDHELALEHPLERARLDAALVALETRQLALRARFELGPSGLVQRCAAPRASVLEHQPPAQLRFDLERGPLWRAFAWTDAEGRARLRLVVHHIAGDAASMVTLISELAARYRGRELPPLTHDYRELAAWQRAQLDAGPEHGPARASIEQLRGLEPIPLPLAHPRPARQRYEGARADLELCPRLSAALRERASAGKTTLYTALLTGLAAVLARWSGAAEFAIGSPLGLRPHPAAAPLVGPFMSLAVLRVDARADPSLAALLERLRSESTRAFARAQLPFEELLRVLAPARQLDRPPLFQVLFNMVDAGELERAWAELGARRLPPAELVARYDLACYAQPRDEGLSLSIVYARALFSAEQIERLLAHLEAALTQLCETPARPLSELRLEPALRPRAGGACASLAPAGIFPRLSTLAVERGDAPALRAGELELSYAALHQLSLRLADRLRPLAPAQRVGLLCAHDHAMVAALLATLARGCAYVPLDPHLPAARLSEIIEDAQLSALACAPSLRARAAELAARAELPLLELEPSVASSEPLALPAPTLEHPAYILYTSGSTGRPKGVVQSQANLIHHASSYAHSVGLGPGVRVSLVASYAFDAALMDTYGALVSGAQLCLIDLGEPSQLARLAEQLCAARVEVFHATPTLWRELVAQLDAGAAPPPLRCVVLGGEEARGDDLVALRRHFGPDCALINGLGPTECTLALQHRAASGAEPSSASLAIGSPTPGVRAHLRTPLGEQVAPFGIGELVLESPHLALAYWRRPQQTRAAFFRSATGQRCYASGDLARIEANGELRFMGRRDAQVEIHGRRVELGEIEARIRALEGVREAGVSLRGDAARPWLAAHIVALADRELDPLALRAALARQLPTWMLPRSLVLVEALPKSATAKLDRRALAALPVAPVSVERKPGSAVERSLAQLWAEAIGVDAAALSPELDFFASGGDSLAALRFVRAARAQLGLELELAELFEGASLGALAARLRGLELDRPARASLHPARAQAGEPPRCAIILPPGAAAELASALAAELAEQGLAACVLRPPSFGHAGPLPRIEDLAAACAAILAPTIDTLIGISNGGLLALAIARSLSQPSAKVALLDTIPPPLLARDPFSQRSPARRRAAFMASWAGVPVAPAQLEGEPESALEQMRERASSAGRPLAQLPAAALGELLETYERHAERVWRVLSELELGPLLAPESGSEPPEVQLLAATQPPSSPIAAAWRELWPALAVHAVPGDHLGMLNPPHVGAVAARLRELLAPA